MHQPLVAGGSALAAGLLGLQAATRQARAAQAPTAASYLAKAHRSLSPRAGVASVLDTFRRVGAPRMKRHDGSYFGGAL